MMNAYNWYQLLNKPSWAPSASVFGPVWTVLYIIIAISFGVVFYKVFKKQLPSSVALPFALNIVFNVLFMPLMFGLQNIALGSLVILLTVVTLIWAMGVIYPRLKWVALVNIPYLLWLLIATILQFSVAYLN